METSRLLSLSLVCLLLKRVLMFDKMFLDEVVSQHNMIHALISLYIPILKVEKQEKTVSSVF